MSFSQGIKSSPLYRSFYVGSWLQKTFKQVNEWPYMLSMAWRKYKDLLFSLRDGKLLRFHLDSRAILDRQKREWDKFVYSWGYFYQGSKRLGVSGVRPTDIRLRNYAMERYLDKDMRVLDIGANAGFFAIELAPHVAHIDAIEWNPYLVEIGQRAIDILGIKNISMMAVDFNDFQPQAKYQAILSFANHHTTDGGMRPELRSYFENLRRMLSPNGLLFFEGHPQDNNPLFRQFMAELKGLFHAVEEKTVTDGKLGGVRPFYVLRAE